MAKKTDIRRLHDEIATRGTSHYKIYTICSEVSSPSGFTIKGTTFENLPNIKITADFVIEEAQAIVDMHDDSDAAKIHRIKLLFCDEIDGIMRPMADATTTVTLSPSDLAIQPDIGEKSKFVNMSGYVSQLLQMKQVFEDVGYLPEEIRTKLNSFTVEMYQAFEIERLKLAQPSPTLTTLNSVVKVYDIANAALVRSVAQLEKNGQWLADKTDKTVDHLETRLSGEEARTDRLADKVEKGMVGPAIEAFAKVVESASVLASSEGGLELIRKLVPDQNLLVQTPKETKK